MSRPTTFRAEQMLEAEYLEHFENWSWKALGRRYGVHNTTVWRAVTGAEKNRNLESQRSPEQYLRWRLRAEARAEAAEKKIPVQQLYEQWGVA